MVIRKGVGSSEETEIVYTNDDENLVYAELKRLIPTATLKNEIFFYTCKK